MGGLSSTSGLQPRSWNIGGKKPAGINRQMPENKILDGIRTIDYKEFIDNPVLEKYKINTIANEKLD